MIAPVAGPRSLKLDAWAVFCPGAAAKSKGPPAQHHGWLKGCGDIAGHRARGGFGALILIIAGIAGNAGRSCYPVAAMTDRSGRESGRPLIRRKPGIRIA